LLNIVETISFITLKSLIKFPVLGFSLSYLAGLLLVYGLRL
jgi:hypothetical protein